VLSGEAANANFIVFGLTFWPFDPTGTQTQFLPLSRQAQWPLRHDVVQNKINVVLYDMVWITQTFKNMSLLRAITQNNINCKYIIPCLKGINIKRQRKFSSYDSPLCHYTEVLIKYLLLSNFCLFWQNIPH
jgi:hypothetical protein